MAGDAISIPGQFSGSSAGGDSSAGPVSTTVGFGSTTVNAKDKSSMLILGALVVAVIYLTHRA